LGVAPVTIGGGHTHFPSAFMTCGGGQTGGGGETGTHAPPTGTVPSGHTHVPGTAPVTIGGGHTQMPSTFMTCGGGQEHELGFDTVAQELLFVGTVST
jgi:hypothetical protein